MSALKPSLLRMFTAHEAVGARWVGGAEMKKHRKVRSLVTWSKVERSVFVFVATCESTHATHTDALA